MFEQVWNRVVRGTYRSFQGVVAGFERRFVERETYPCLIPTDGNHPVDGIVYLDVVKSDLARLDRFEGAYYERLTTRCKVMHGEFLDVAVYVFKPEYQELVAPKAWDPDWFEEFGLSIFLKRYTGFS